MKKVLMQKKFQKAGLIKMNDLKLNKELYKYVNILEYHDGTYVLTNPISDTNIREMRNNMDTSDIADFDKFVEENWGIKSKPYYDEEEIVETKKRGRKPKEN